MAMTRGAFGAALAVARARGDIPKRLPRAAEPLAGQRRYARRLKERVLEPALKLVRERLVPALERLAENASRVATTDAESPDLGDIIDEISDTYFAQMSRRDFAKVVRPVGDETARFNATQLNKQLSAAIGEAISVDVVGSEPWLQAAIDEFTRENVALIRTVPEQFFSELEKAIAREVADGGRFEELMDAIEERYSVSESRAELIARDQVNKFQGDLSRVRQRDLGIKSFVWRTMGDERVRDSHALRNGQRYEWSDPPEGETPGEPIQCRCHAEPDVESVFEG